jgi:hypothetical protein
VIADKGDHARDVLKCLADGPWSTRIAEPRRRSVLRWHGDDDARRAVYAGLELIGTVSGLVTQAGETLAARVGIATGLVMVGELIGDGGAQEEAIVGETPNLAARLQAVAAAGEVVIAPGTRRLVGGLFGLARLRVQHLKGFVDPVPVWRVVGEAPVEWRFEALRGTRLTYLVGREHELGLLLERWAWAKDGEGQVILLAGEPGIGKSRIVRALRERLGAEPYTPLRHFCSPHHQNTALYPVIGLLERATDFAPGDSAERQLDNLEAMLALSADDVHDAAPLLAALLGIALGERYPPLDLAPQRLKQRTLEVLLAQIEGLARRQPVLAVYEDVQWVDPTTLELLGLVIERVRRLPVLVVITFRPGFKPPWGGHPHVTHVPLGRLARRQAAEMIARIGGGKALPPALVEQILARTEGVPLFVEELTKTVLESGLLRDAGERYELSGPLPPLAIPMTLHDSLMARLDRLAPVKTLVQTAAVIGREFSHELLGAVARLPAAELDASLDQMIASELVLGHCQATPGSDPLATRRTDPLGGVGVAGGLSR